MIAFNLPLRHRVIGRASRVRQAVPGGARVLVSAIPRIERRPVDTQFPQRAPHGEIRALDQADHLALLGGRQSHVSSSEPEAVRFFFSTRFSSTVSATTCLSWLF